MRLNIRVSRKKPESLTRQITDQLSQLIESGAAAAGSLLPSERELANSLKVARNVVRGVVQEVAILGDRARVRLTGAPALVAEITTGSAERMGVVAGAEVWASFKAVEIRLMVEPGPPDTL